MRVRQTVVVGKVPYTVVAIGEAGTGKFFNRRSVTLRDADGNLFTTLAKGSRVSWNARLTPKVEQ